jgi:uncharacterized SAM-binding protein YcdF (DUF218 family)
MKRPKSMHRNIFAYIFLFLLASDGALFYGYAGPKEEQPMLKADAIVLLAGNYKERAPTAAALYRKSYAPVILLTNDGVFSSWSAKYGRNLYQVEWTEEDLVRLGVPRKSIVKLPFYGSSTMHDALAVRRYALTYRLKKIIIVTSDYHMPRALWTFRKVFSGQQVDFFGYPAKTHSIGIWGRVVEHGKFLYYLIKYGSTGMGSERDGQHVAGVDGHK